MAAETEKSLMTRILAGLGLTRVGTTERKTVTFGDGSAITGSLFWSIIGIVALMTLWILSARFEWTDPEFLPGPGSVWDKYREVALEGHRRVTLGEHVRASLSRILWGFGYGCLVGFPLGLAMGL